jgi:hypothetical protein
MAKTATKKKMIVKRSHKRKPDVYDREVKRLTKSPGLIAHAWYNAFPLFQWAADKSMPGSGCVSMVKCGSCLAATPEITKAIRSDKKLSENTADLIPVEELPRYAYWQRRIDKALGRKAPTHV